MTFWILLLSFLGGFLRPGISQFATDGCGTTKGCFKNPSSCIGSADCEFFASWVYDADNNVVNFQISATKATSFVALGLSKSGSMDASDVYACTMNEEVRRSRNTAYFANMPEPLKGVSDVTITVTDGRIDCEFNRQLKLNDNDDTFFDLSGNNRYTVIMSRSSSALANGNIVAHAPLDPPSGGRIKDSAPVSFTQFMKPNTATDQPDNAMTSAAVAMTSHVATETRTVPTTQSTAVELIAGCGVTKGCFRHPLDCSGVGDCSFFVSWMSDEANNIVFRMTGTTSTDGSYIALGFSKSGMMRDSEVYACTKNNEVVRSFNTVRNENDPDLPLKGVSKTTVSIVDGRIDCEFTRQASLNDDDVTYFDLSGSNAYYITMAKSSGQLREGGDIDYHYGGKTAGTVQTSFQAFTVTGGKEDELGFTLKKCHGGLMVAAWVLFASLGITLARFYKKMWPETMLCGKPVWFSLHRVCMVLTSLCTVVAFIIIFVQTKEFVQLNEGLSGVLRFLHAVLGTVVTFLVILNPVMAIFRPHPGEPRRALFNWAHWAVGTGAHLIAMVTICLGLGYRSALPLITGLPVHIFWVMIVFIAFHIIMWLLLQIQQCMQVQKGDDDIPMFENSTSFQEQLIEEELQKPLGSGTMNILLLIYLLGVVIAAFFIIITIASVRQPI